ncbi:MAG: YidC/Oxa1 family membrane protein insertase [Firmicutes bacterium]|nr:YidC/Oxa1 family membrane protein insertase [Bacillota bacterium]
MTTNFYLASSLMREPGVIVGPIAKFLGLIVNVLFNWVYSFTQANSLGITIIIFTVFVRLLMIPIAYNQQKSMFIMRKIQPEIQKIQDKYKGMLNDPDVQRRMSMETQRVYRDHNYNMFSGCLPLLIQMPIFFGLYYVMRHPFAYIETINTIYSSISDGILGSIQSGNDHALDLFTTVCTRLRIDEGTEVTTSMFNYILNAIEPEEVKNFVSYVGNSDISSLYEQKTVIESFLGLNLTETPTLALSKNLILPILSGFTTWLSSWLMSRKNQPTDPAMKSQQNIMNITMPLLMAWFTTSVPAGLGVYWITGNIFMIFQQLILNKHFELKEARENANGKEGQKK